MAMHTVLDKGVLVDMVWDNKEQDKASDKQHNMDRGNRNTHPEEMPTQRPIRAKSLSVSRQRSFILCIHQLNTKYYPNVHTTDLKMTVC